MDKNQESTILRLYSPEGDERQLALEKQLSIGKDKSNDFTLDHPSIDDFHCILKQKNQVIAIHNLAQGDFQTYVETFKLGQGKMYLLSPGDRLTLGDYQLLIPVKQQNKKEKKQENKSTKEESTAPAIVLSDIEGSEENEEAIDIDEIEMETEESQAEIDLPDIDLEDSDSGSLDLPALPQTDSSDDEQEDDSSEEHQSDDDISLSGLIVRDDLKGLEDDEEEFEEEDDEEEFSDTDQRMLEAIQQGRQPDYAGTDTSIFSRIFRLRHRLDREKEKTKSQLFQRIALPAPSPFLRIYGQFASIPLAFFIAYTLVPVLKLKAPIKEFLGPIAEMISEALSLTPNYLPALHEVLYFITCAIIFDLLSHLVLGTSLPYFFLGIKSNHSELKKRWKGFMRALVNIFTMPFLIFDLPALFKKPTLKEWLLKAELGIEGNRFLRLFAAVIIIPTMMVCCFYLPFTIDPDNVAGMTLERITTKGRTIANGKELALGLSSLSISFKSQIAQDIHFLPYFKIDNNHFAPTLMAFKDDQDQLVSLSSPTSIDFNELIELVKTNDPLFVAKYPLLSAHSQGGKWQDNEAEELANLIEDSLTLTPENFHIHLLERGPFITGDLLFRKALIEKIGLWQVSAATLLKTADQLILEFKDPLNNRFLNNYYIPLTEKKSQVYKLSFAQISSKLAIQLEQQFLFRAKYGNESLIPREEQTTSPVIILDFFNNLESLRTPETQQQIIDLYHNWDAKGREELTKKSINSLIKTMKTRYKSDEASFSALFEGLEKQLTELTPIPAKEQDETPQEEIKQ